MAAKKKPSTPVPKFEPNVVAWYRRVEKQLHTLESYASTANVSKTPWLASMSRYHARELADLLLARPAGAADPGGWFEGRVLSALAAVETG